MNLIPDLDLDTNMSSSSSSPVPVQHPARGDFLKWTIPSFVQHSEDGLASVSQDVLEECLQPVLQGLAEIDAEELLDLKRVPEGTLGAARLQNGIHVRPIHKQVTPFCQGEGSVRYVHISEVPGQYSMGIFIFPPHAKIPLHDHPGMCVLSRVLYGDLQRIALDLGRDDNEDSNDETDAHMQVEKEAAVGSVGVVCKPPPPPPPHQDAPQPLQPQTRHSWFPSWGSARVLAPTTTNTNNDAASDSSDQEESATIVPDHFPSGTKLAFRHDTDKLQAPDTTALYPFAGNVHEFVAGPAGAAVLDVLLPPYDVDHHRDCTFYETVRCPAPKSATITSSISSNGALATTANTISREPCWIVPTGQPEDFHCISGKYREIG